MEIDVVNRSEVGDAGLQHLNADHDLMDLPARKESDKRRNRELTQLRADGSPTIWSRRVSVGEMELAAVSVVELQLDDAASQRGFFEVEGERVVRQLTGVAGQRPVRGKSVREPEAGEGAAVHRIGDEEKRGARAGESLCIHTDGEQLRRAGLGIIVGLPGLKQVRVVAGGSILKTVHHTEGRIRRRPQISKPGERPRDAGRNGDRVLMIGRAGAGQEMG